MAKKIDVSGWKRSNTFKGGFSSYLDGKFHNYQGLEACMDEIKDLVEDAFAYAERMAKENEELKDLHWENEQLQHMKQELTQAKADYYRGFAISESESKAIEEWKDKHWTEQHKAPDNESRLRKMGAIGGSFYYKFVPTSIGTIGSVCCSACMNKAQMDAGNNRDRLRKLIKEYDAEFDFQDL